MLQATYYPHRKNSDSFQNEAISTRLASDPHLALQGAAQVPCTSLHAIHFCNFAAFQIPVALVLRAARPSNIMPPWLAEFAQRLSFGESPTEVAVDSRVQLVGYRRFDKCGPALVEVLVLAVWLPNPAVPCACVVAPPSCSFSLVVSAGVAPAL